MNTDIQNNIKIKERLSSLHFYALCVIFVLLTLELIVAQFVPFNTGGAYRALPICGFLCVLAKKPYRFYLFNADGIFFYENDRLLAHIRPPFSTLRTASPLYHRSQLKCAPSVFKIIGALDLFYFALLKFCAYLLCKNLRNWRFKNGILLCCEDGEILQIWTAYASEYETIRNYFLNVYNIDIDNLLEDKELKYCARERIER